MASGNLLASITPGANQYPSTNYALPDVNNSRQVLSFSDTADWEAVFLLWLPPNYNNGGLTLRLVLSTPSGGATSGNMIWGASIKRLQDATDDLSGTGFATEQTVTVAAPGTAQQVKYASITFTDGSQMDSVAVNEAFLLKIRRVGSSGSDTMTGRGHLVAGELRET
jgi:hypothetical protein